MQHFSYEEIKAALPCDQYVAAIPGVKNFGNGRYTSPLRADSDSPSFAANKDGWHDHVSKESGSVLDLEATLYHGGDIFAAQEALGNRLGLKPREQKPREAQHETAVYVYTDQDGKPLFEVVRLEPGDHGKRKTFRQRTVNPDGSKSWSVKSSLLVPYKLHLWKDSKYVVIVEGEKDADSLLAHKQPATTLPDGAAKWRDEYRQYFEGKTVLISRDNDPAGEYHADRLAWELRETAKQIKVVCPDTRAKGADVSDFLADHTIDQFLALAAAAEWIDLGKVKEPPPFKEYEASAAKRANASPFANTEWVSGTGEDKGKRVKMPRKIGEMLTELFVRFWDFPRLCGDTLFDHDRDKKTIRFIDTPTALFAWIQEKSGHPVHWDRLSGCVSKEEFFEAVKNNTREYSAISGVPSWPARSDVYQTFESLPEPTPDARYFEQFAGFFCPASAVDAVLLRAAIATPLYYRHGERRPAFVIDGQGQGSGKTIFVEMVALLYGGFDAEQSSPISATAAQIKDHQAYDRFIRRCLSTGGRKKRMILIDNVTGSFGSANFAALQSSEYITGMAPYGRHEESRPNDLTIFLTSNSGTFDKDLVDRSYFIELARPDRRPNWVAEVREFIHQHRLQVIADIVGLIERGAGFEFVPESRYADWEKNFLAPVCRDLETYEAVWKSTVEDREDADREREQGERIREEFLAAIARTGFSEKRLLFFRSEAACSLVAKVDPTIHSANLAMSILRNLAKTGVIPELAADPQRHYLPNGQRVRGIYWGDPARNPNAAIDVVESYDGGVLRLKGAEI